MRKQISVGIVVFNPSNNLLSRLSLVLKLGYSLYLFDNSPGQDMVREYCKQHDDCHYSTCGKNVGLGFGLSSVGASAYYDGHPALIFFDQDTVFQDSTLNFIDGFYETNKTFLSDYSAVVFNAKKKTPETDDNAFAYNDVLMAISSGSLFLLDKLKQMNWHNTSYFVDCVDYEFCLNSSNHGYRIGECSTTPGYDHSAEQPDFEYDLWGRKLRLRKYPTIRVKDTIQGSVRLWLASLKSLNVRFLVATTRSFVIYLGGQCLAHLVPKHKSAKRKPQ
jgi:rhamnosyltransferase